MGTGIGNGLDDVCGVGEGAGDAPGAGDEGDDFGGADVAGTGRCGRAGGTDARWLGPLTPRTRFLIAP